MWNIIGKVGFFGTAGKGTKWGFGWSGHDETHRAAEGWMVI